MLPNAKRELYLVEIPRPEEVKLSVTKDQPKTAVCKSCKKRLPTNSDHWFQKKDGGLYTEARCKKCEREYRAGKKAAAEAESPTDAEGD